MFLPQTEQVHIWKHCDCSGWADPGVRFLVTTVAQKLIIRPFPKKVSHKTCPWRPLLQRCVIAWVLCPF